MREETITRQTIADPRSHYGDAKASTRHFILQRLSGVSNIVFLLLLLFIVVSLAGEDRTDMVETVGNPLIGLPFALTLGILTLHMRNGMRDVLEDYFRGRTYRLYMMLNSLFCLIIALLGIGAILKLVFWG
ncbi:succinate dehydrogenase, hydrophobic membrane anchor protein [Devosia submarina]|uniref:succinate dehydrogenase, hydrophobic membrane anchor protein n=1 Tax=Devosia submarina TaxID=1173082 RepID=UPI000D3B7231|nr:succinate dehydrogenase, hydrophobic membrane anchor protein [Devosia submarina]